MLLRCVDLVNKCWPNVDQFYVFGKYYVWGFQNCFDCSQTKSGSDYKWKSTFKLFSKIWRFWFKNSVFSRYSKPWKFWKFQNRIKNYVAVRIQWSGRFWKGETSLFSNFQLWSTFSQHMLPKNHIINHEIPCFCGFVVISTLMLINN